MLEFYLIWVAVVFIMLTLAVLLVWLAAPKELKAIAERCNNGYMVAIRNILLFALIPPIGTYVIINGVIKGMKQ